MSVPESSWLTDAGRAGERGWLATEGFQVVTLAIRLDPRLLDNPDADIRYQLPNLLAERSGGVITDNGYDYVGPEPLMVVFLEASELEHAFVCVVDVIENVPVVGCSLRPGAVVAVKRKSGWEVVYPPGFAGPFLPQ
jgi:hypothetical protein